MSCSMYTIQPQMRSVRFYYVWRLMKWWFVDSFGQVISKVPIATQAEMESAVEAAKAAYRIWSRTSILTRQQVMFRYQHIIRHNIVMCLALTNRDNDHQRNLFHFRKIWREPSLKNKARRCWMRKEMFSEDFVSGMWTMMKLTTQFIKVHLLFVQQRSSNTVAAFQASRWVNH